MANEGIRGIRDTICDTSVDSFPLGTGVHLSLLKGKEGRKKEREREYLSQIEHFCHQESISQMKTHLITIIFDHFVSGQLHPQIVKNSRTRQRGREREEGH